MYAAAIILLLTVGLGIFVDRRYDQMHRLELDISTLLERMLRFNSDLTYMLSHAVVERNALRTSGYATAAAALANTLDTVATMSAELGQLDEINALITESADLRLQEQAAIDSMQVDDWEAAQRVLFGETYLRARKIYEIDSDAAVVALSGALAQASKERERWRETFVVLRMGSVALLLWTGVLFSSRLRRELAEQARLRLALTNANSELEQKVQQRTAELETLNQRLAQLSITDGLTGLANRRHFDEAFETEWQRALRQGTPLAVLMLDVDHFKRYNDHYGHVAGDDCLRAVAGILKAAVRRAGELPARYGGEEFVVLLPGATEANALAEAENIRSGLELLSLPHTTSDVAQVVTVSVGVALFQPQRGQNPYSLIQAADAALYEAKHGGRNRVVLSSPPPSSG